MLVQCELSMMFLACGCDVSRQSPGEVDTHKSQYGC